MGELNKITRRNQPISNTDHPILLLFKNQTNCSREKSRIFLLKNRQAYASPIQEEMFRGRPELLAYTTADEEQPGTQQVHWGVTEIFWKMGPTLFAIPIQTDHVVHNMDSAGTPMPIANTKISVFYPKTRMNVNGPPEIVILTHYLVGFVKTP